MNKQGEKGLVLNLWRKRWFQLDSNAQKIYYYKTKSKEELLGSINLAEASGVVSTEPKDTFSFTIHTRDRAWNLSASSDIDKQAWINAISQVISRSSAAARPNGVQFDLPSSSTTTPGKSSEYLGIFEFEGEDGDAKIPAGEAIEEASGSAALTFDFDDDDDLGEDDYRLPAPPNPTPKEDRSFLCGSLPVNVPRLASTWQANPTWTFADADDTADARFEQPHEMAARTYKEITLETGIDFVRPRTHSKRMQAYI